MSQQAGIGVFPYKKDVKTKPQIPPKANPIIMPIYIGLIILPPL
jgi:hypothetical protein